MAEAALRKPAELSFEGNLAHNWSAFEEEFEIYSNATLYDKTSKVKAYTLLNLAGPEAVKRAKNVLYKEEIKNGDEVIQAAESKENVDDLIKKFRELCNPQSNVSMERHIFFTRDQKPRESIDSYITDLKQKARSCELANLQDELIRDRFISGVQSEQLRRVLLKETDLTLTRALEIAQLDEITQSRLKQFKRDKEIHFIKKSNPPGIKSNICGNCGSKHATGKCPAKGRKCNNCLKYNHFAKMCRSKPAKQSSGGQPQTGKQAKQYKKPHDILHCDVDSDDQEDEYLVINTVHVDKKAKDEVFVNLQLNNEVVTLKIDSGAKCNVISRDLASQISKAQRTPIKVNRKNKVKLLAYGGDSFYTLGTATFNCTHQDQTHNLEFQIVDKPVQSLLGLQDSLRLKLFTLASEVYEVKAQGKMQIFQEYANLFEDKLGKLPGKCKLVVDSTVQPIARSAQKLPAAMKHKVKTELDFMESQGVISKMTEPTEWCSNMVCAKKKDGNSIRLCIDPLFLNKALKRPHHPLRTIEDILTEMPNAKIFSVLNAKNSFWQISLDDESRKLTCFSTIFGRYVFNVLPYGVTVGSEVYQQKVEELFKDVRCMLIVDDILVWGSDEQDHDRKLKKVLDRCSEIGMKLNPKKCQFKVTKVPYVGHILSDTGVHPDPEKVRAITEMPAPSDVKGLQRFLGMVNYLSKFSQLQSTLTTTLRELLHKDVEFRWEENHTKAFNAIKTAVANITALQFYDVKKPVTVTADASKDGIGCALLQEGKPIHFASRALTSSEANMAQIQKELLAIVFATQKFRHYIYGKSVTVETDHKPLVTILKKPISDAPISLQKMLLKLLDYDLHLIHKSTTQMPISDTLSRAFLTNTEAVEEDEYEVLCVTHVTQNKAERIREATKKDSTMQALIAVINHGWPDRRHEVSKSLRPYFPFRHELIADNGLIFKANRIVIPSSMRDDILEQLHYPHVGIEATMRRAKESVFWDSINNDIKAWAETCTTCISHKPYQKKESFPVPKFPWEIVAVDVFEWHNKQYLLTTDTYSGWFEIDELPSLRSATVINKLKQHFSRFGIPATLYSDSAPNLTSQEMKDFCRTWGNSTPH